MLGWGVSERVTIREVAEAAGVSVATVSLALRGSPQTSKATQERVKRVAEEIGYRPNPAFAALGSRSGLRKQNRAGMPLAYLFEGRESLAVVKANHIDDAQRRAHELGYALEALCVDDFGSKRELERTLYHRGVAGVLIGRLERTGWLTEVDWSPFAVVTISRYLEKLPFHCLRSSMVETGRLAWEKIWEAGYRRIGVAVRFPDRLAAEDPMRLAGCYAGQWELAGRAFDVEPLALKPGEGKTLVARWLKQERPDAVVTFPWPLAEELWKAGVPAAGLLLKNAPSGLAGTVNHGMGLAGMAVELLDEMIRSGERGLPRRARDIVIFPEWREGDSLPPRGEA